MQFKSVRKASEKIIIICSKHRKEGVMSANQYFPINAHHFTSSTSIEDFRCILYGENARMRELYDSSSMTHAASELPIRKLSVVAILLDRL